jgi:hypothetical protein
MKSCSAILILSFTIFATGCTITPKKPKPVVIPGSGDLYQIWHDSVLEKGMVFTEQDVINIHKYLTEKCSVNSGIVI